MENIRKYGDSLFNIVLIHGGPGASGEMKPVAEELSENLSVLEPLQTKNSIAGQIKELKEQIENHSDFPVVLVGYSWGAWLCYIFTSNYPELVKKLILISSGSFEERYVKEMNEVRNHRLGEKEQVELQQLNELLKNSESDNKNEVFKKIGEIFGAADAYNPEEIKHDTETHADIYEKVWPEAAKLRQTGELLKFGEKIECPVVAIHGDYDPHPVNGVKESLSKVLKDFKFILLKNCGHKPWIEKEAKQKFYEILREEIS